MNRNDLSTAGALKVGDRFYKANDKKKKVYQLVEADKKVTHFRTYKLFCCPADVIDNDYMSEALKRRQFVPIINNTVVVFLRSAVEIEPIQL